MAASLRRAPPNRENIVRISGGRFIGIGLAAVPTSRAHCRARRDAALGLPRTPAPVNAGFDRRALRTQRRGNRAADDERYVAPGRFAPRRRRQRRRASTGGAGASRPTKTAATTDARHHSKGFLCLCALEKRHEMDHA
ncbi:hypothetical protein [Burkholderia pseudomallei]|uniref:hypothetical protein n=1 Tax=Burkholderia pseudomallei TaxID=28450 RepID=UPI0015C374C7|nr:hypothetical protein [Burkholderia pseudomallei]